MFWCIKFIAILFLSWFLYSCEPVYHADIKNDTDKELLLELKFNKLTLEQHWKGLPYNDFLKSYPNNAQAHLIKHDSLENKNYYLIPAKTSFPLERGIGTKPTYDLFEYLKIIGSDTFKLMNRKAIEDAFTKIDKRRWELNIAK